MQAVERIRGTGKFLDMTPFDFLGGGLVSNKYWLLVCSPGVLFDGHVAYTHTRDAFVI